MTSQTITPIDLCLIVPGDNDRKTFDQNELAELASSIREHGLIQPISVRPLADTELYQIIAGERRFRACQMLNWETVPAIILDVSDEEASALMLAENVARQDLDPIDEAMAYQIRLDRFGWSVADCARRAGVSTVRVKFRLKLLKLNSDIQRLVRSGQLPLGYAQILADANLESDFQRLALRQYRDNPHPTPGWFRRQVGQLLEQQAQARLFDQPLFGGPLQAVAVEPSAPVEPPHPSTTTPPQQGKSPKEMLAGQVDFWQQAAKAWDALGKPFKRQECEAAALALQSALNFI